MSKIGIFMADGCEEIEGLTVVDVLRRAKMDITTISIGKTTSVTGSHQITFTADTIMEDVNFDEFDGIVLPGGIPGTPNLAANEIVMDTVRTFAAKGKLVAAICAAPSILGDAGLLEGKHATCHPGFEPHLKGAITSEEPVVCDDNFITSRGMGTAISFALAIVARYESQEVVDDVKLHMVYR